MSKRKLTGSEIFVKCPCGHVFKTGKKEPQCYKCKKQVDVNKCSI